MSCQVEGNADMYGLGIRVGFYLQWYGSIAAEWLPVAADSVLGLRFANSFFISATFLALIIQTSLNSLRSIDIYIIILLTYGAFYYFVPLYIWRLIICCSPFWDPSRWPRIHTSHIYSVLYYTLLATVSLYQMWFWCTGINQVPGLPDGCQGYGFFFAMVPLNNAGFVAVNILLNLGLLLVCFVLLCFILEIVRPPSSLREKIYEAEREEYDKDRAHGLQVLNSLIRLAIASIIVAATELTIQWNNLTGVNDVSTAGQTIPLVIGLSALVRILYLAFKEDNDDDSGASQPPGPQPQDPFPVPVPMERPVPAPIPPFHIPERPHEQGPRPQSVMEVPIETRGVSGARRERRR